MRTLRKKLSPRKVALRVYSRFEGRNVFARVAVAGDPHVALGGCVELELFHYQLQKVLGRRRIRRLLPGAAEEVAFSLAGVPLGTCWFRATFIDRHGCRMAAEVIQDKMPPRAWWLGSKAGISGKVPAPWTPLKVGRTGGGLSVQCWGRTHRFDRSSLLRQVDSAAAKLLAAPVRLAGKADGRAIVWKGNAPRLIGRDAAQVVMEQEFRSGALRLAVRSEMEFDGVLRLDCRLSAARRVRLESLTLDVPVVESHAEYFYRFPGTWGSAENVHALPARGMTMGFQPYIWLGDNERGLACFCESDRHWFHADSRPAIEVSRRGGRALLRLNLVSRPVELLPDGANAAESSTGVGTGMDLPALSALEYTFGLQATPVKPPQKDAWDYRAICLGTEMFDALNPKPLQVKLSLLDKLAAAGVKTLVIFEYWTDAEGHALTTHGPEVRRIVRACHERGMKALLYFGFLISDLAPEWREFGKECVVLPKGGYPVLHCLPQPEQSAWRVCLRSAWQDFVPAGIAHAMDEFGVDGVYLDGTHWPFACANTLHGCGVVQTDGKVSPAYPLFATRSAMRRIYNVVRSRNPDGIINVHNSTCMTTPSLAWATSCWDGEQFGHLAKGTDVNRLLPLDAFRAEFMGRQWGLATEFLCYGRPFTFEQAWSFCLLHDVPVRPSHLEPDLPIAARIWKVMDDFDRKGARWVPYWDDSGLVTASPAGTCVSLYLHPRNGVLAVVSNLSSRKATVRVRFNLPRLRLTGAVQTARDAYAQRDLPIRKGTVELPLRPLEWRLIRLNSGQT